MNMHKNARLTPFGRERLVKQVLERVLTPAAVAAAAGVSLRTIGGSLAMNAHPVRRVGLKESPDPASIRKPCCREDSFPCPHTAQGIARETKKHQAHSDSHRAR
jgi:hypothetical protein